MLVTIDVTAEDIAKGLPDSACECPIAFAVQRCVPHASEVAVTNFNIRARLNPFALLQRMVLPAPAQAFIRQFDRREQVKPFSFAINIPGPTIAINLSEAK